MKLTHFSVIGAITIVLAGCGATDFKKYEAHIDDVKGEVNVYEDQLGARHERVRELSRPPIDATPLIRQVEIPWLSEEVKIGAVDMPLSVVLEQVVGSAVEVRWTGGVKVNKPVTMNITGTRELALNRLMAEASVEFEPGPQSVKVVEYVTKTFTLPITAADTEQSIGYESGGASGSDTSASQTGAEISSTGGSDGQRSIARLTTESMAVQLVDGIESIIAMPEDEDVLFGTVRVVPQYNSVVVTTRPSLMDRVAEFVDTQIDLALRSVELELYVIEFQSDKETEFGLAGNLRRNTGNGGFNLALSPPSNASLVEGYGLGWEGAGKWADSLALMKALQGYGKVSVTNYQVITAANQQTQEYDFSDIQSYISRTSTTIESDSGVPLVEVHIDTVKDGIKLVAMPAVADDHVYLRMTGTLSKFLRFDEQDVSGVMVSSPHTRQSKINITGRFEYNQPVIVAYMRHDTTQSSASSIAKNPLLGGHAATQKLTDTLVILTPKRLF